MVLGVQFRPLYLAPIEQLRDSVVGAVDPGKLGIIDNGGLAAFEGQADFKDIWLVTGDLAEDVPSAPYFEVVHGNLRRGISYTYYCPRSARTEGRVASIKRAHGKTHGALRFVFLPDDFFFLTTRMDFCIYDPLNVSGRRCGFMGLPMDTDRHLHGRIDSELIDSLVGKLGPHLSLEEDK